jgi:sialate O-acetylesterase
MAVAIDVGDLKNIHPHNKRAVGERLALQALKVAYGQKLTASGPTFSSMRTAKGKATLTFTQTGKGLKDVNGGNLEGFAVAGADRTFRWATAKIDGSTVIVSSTAVPQPVAVRYAWGNSPACDLANSADLPAVPFRTDDWPMAAPATTPKPSPTPAATPTPSPTPTPVAP